MRRSVVDLHFSGWRNLKIDSNGDGDECDSTKRAKNVEKSSRTTEAAAAATTTKSERVIHIKYERPHPYMSIVFCVFQLMCR